MTNAPKTVLAIHDLPGFGRAALSVIAPVLSTLGVQTVALPTAVLSTHTGGLGAPAKLADPNYGPAALAHYHRLGVKFDCIYSGYLADTARPAREKLLDFVGRSLEISVSDPVLYKAFIHGLRYPEQRVLQKNAGRVYFRVLLELVTLCQQEGSIHPSHDPDQVVEELVVLHRGALFEWRIYQGGFDLPQLGRRMAGRLLRGLYYAE